MDYWAQWTAIFIDNGTEWRAVWSELMRVIS